MFERLTFETMPLETAVKLTKNKNAMYADLHTVFIIKPLAHVLVHVKSY